MRLVELLWIFLEVEEDPLEVSGWDFDRLEFLHHGVHAGLGHPGEPVGVQASRL